MKQDVHRRLLVALSVTTTVIGELALLFLFPSAIDRLGGINLLSLSLAMLFSSAFLLPSLFILRRAQGKPIRRWQIEVVQAYFGLAILLALGFVYDALLQDKVLFIWPFGILPLLTMLGAFYLLRRIPKVKRKLDELSQNW